MHYKGKKIIFYRIITKEGKISIPKKYMRKLKGKFAIIHLYWKK